MPQARFSLLLSIVIALGTVWLTSWQLLWSGTMLRWKYGSELAWWVELPWNLDGRGTERGLHPEIAAVECGLCRFLLSTYHPVKLFTLSGGRSKPKLRDVASLLCAGRDCRDAKAICR